jgi:hypothetical protein
VLRRAQARRYECRWRDDDYCHSRRDRAAEERHRTELRRAIAAGVDADRAVEAIHDRLPADGAPDRLGERRQIGEADRQLDGEVRGGAGGERQTERQVNGAGA